MEVEKQRGRVAQGVRELRHRLGDTQQEFAVRMNLSIGSIARYETNAKPSRRVLRKLRAIASDSGFADLVTTFDEQVENQRVVAVLNVEAYVYSILLDKLSSRLQSTALLEQAWAAIVVLLDRNTRRKMKIRKLVDEALSQDPEMFPDPSTLPKLAKRLSDALQTHEMTTISEAIEEIRGILPTPED